MVKWLTIQAILKLNYLTHCYQVLEYDQTFGGIWCAAKDMVNI